MALRFRIKSEQRDTKKHQFRSEQTLNNKHEGKQLITCDGVES